MMKKIKTILIDDENANLIVLDKMLRSHCPQIEIAALASSATEGYELISRLQPELVLLDIRMPDKTGFDLLRMFEKVNFNVIFVSAYDEYAIHAFEFSAIDYILKPIDHAKLIAAVDRATVKISNNINDNLIHFIKTLDEKNNLIKNISLHLNDKVTIVNLDDISCISASRGYSEIQTTNGNKLMSAKPLTDYEEMLAPHGNFIRVNKSVIINADQLKEYTKGENCYLTLKNHPGEIEISRRKKTAVIQYLRSRHI